VTALEPKDDQIVLDRRSALRLLVRMPRSKVLHSAEMRLANGGTIRAPVTHCSKMVPLRSEQLEYSPALNDQICRVCRRTHGFRRMLAARAQRERS